MSRIRTGRYFWIGGISLVFAALLNLSLGSVSVPFVTVIKSLVGGQIDHESWEYIILYFRLPKTLTAVIVGSGLALSGLLMQTLFRNPLAGPYILGISSGASLGVALLIMGVGLFGGAVTWIFNTGYGIIIAAALGSFLVMLAVVLASFKIRNTMALLIIGLMFASLTGAVVNIFSYFSPSEDLQRYVFWSLGSMGNLSWVELILLLIVWVLGVLMSVFCIKGLNALLLGERYARSLGVNLRRNKLLIIIATSVLAGGLTAFVGPIAFVGLAVPHLVRLLLVQSNHLIMVPAVMIAGAVLMLICDTIAQIPGSQLVLPINAVTSLFGAPVVIWLLLRRKKLMF